MIFYFTATGNSLYVAKELAEATGDADLRSIPQELKAEGELRYEADSIGIVCPTFTGLSRASCADSWCGRASRRPTSTL